MGGVVRLDSRKEVVGSIEGWVKAVSNCCLLDEEDGDTSRVDETRSREVRR